MSRPTKLYIHGFREGFDAGNPKKQQYAIRVMCRNCGHEFTSYVEYGKPRPDYVTCINCGCEAGTTVTRRSESDGKEREDV